VNANLGLGISEPLLKTSVPNSLLHQKIETETGSIENYLLIIQNVSQELINEFSKPRQTKNFSVIYLIEEEKIEALDFSVHNISRPNEYSEFKRQFERARTDAKGDYYPPSLPIKLPFNSREIDELSHQLPSKLQLSERESRYATADYE